MADGKKHDKEKLRVDLMPVIGLLRQADVYTRGAKKYDPHNWRKGIEWSRIVGAMIRHALWFAAGESYDPEDGQHHLSSVAWCANTLMEYEITHPELDDRFIPFPPEKLREIIKVMENPQPPSELKDVYFDSDRGNGVVVMCVHCHHLMNNHIPDGTHYCLDCKTGESCYFGVKE